MVQDTSTLHTVQVDCSYKQLSNLPENLPENTVLLNVTNNNVMYLNYWFKKLFCTFSKFLYIFDYKLP
jgi:hypothetical protein